MRTIKCPNCGKRIKKLKTEYTARELFYLVFDNLKFKDWREFKELLNGLVSIGVQKQID